MLYYNYTCRIQLPLPALQNMPAVYLTSLWMARAKQMMVHNNIGAFSFTACAYAQSARLL